MSTRRGSCRLVSTERGWLGKGWRLGVGDVDLDLTAAPPFRLIQQLVCCADHLQLVAIPRFDRGAYDATPQTPSSFTLLLSFLIYAFQYNYNYHHSLAFLHRTLPFYSRPWLRASSNSSSDAQLDPAPHLYYSSSYICSSSESVQSKYSGMSLAASSAQSYS